MNAKMADGASYVTLKYEIVSTLGRTNDPDDYVIKIPFRVFALSCDEPEADEIEIGKGQISRVQVGRAVDDKVGLHFVFDESESTLNAGNSLYNAAYSDFKPSVTSQFPEALWCNDILLIEHISLDAPYRGQRIGLSVMWRIIEDLSDGCYLVVCKPFPLNKGKNYLKAQDKLRRYWERLGFKRIGRSDHWGLCPIGHLKADEDLPRYLRNVR